MIVLVLFITVVTAKIIPDVHEEVEECDTTTPLLAIDFSKMEFNFTTHDVLTLNGPVYILEDYYAPVEIFFRSERFERGAWRTGIMSRRIVDFCAKIKNRFEAWYPISSKLNQQQCPYKKGHIERFDNLEIGTLGMVIPPQFLGEWKLFFEVRLIRYGKATKECLMRRVNFVEA